MSKTIITLDSSQIKQFLICPESWNLKYQQQLRKSGYWTKKYADAGTIFHYLLDRYYTFKSFEKEKDPIKCANNAVKLLKIHGLENELGISDEDRAFIRERFTQYSFNYMNDPMRVLGSGTKLGVETGFSVVIYEDAHYIFVLEGKIDLLADLGGIICFVDHKTRARSDLNLYGLKIQFLCYSLATGFRYGMYNYIGMAAKYDPKKTFERKLHYIPEWRVKEFKEYIIENVYRHLANKQHYTMPRNLNSCSGPDEKRPCEYCMLCDNRNDQKIYDGIKKQFYEKAPRWSPWSVEEEAEEGVTA